MTTLDRLVLPLRVFLVLLFAGLLVGQFFSFPGQFAHLAQEEPDLAHLRWPLTAFAFAELLCVQVVIVCTWRLLTLVRSDRIFSTESFRWVDAILGAMITGWLLLVGLAVFVFTQSDDPGTPALFAGLVLTGAVVILLMAVMRALLRQATTLRTDLEAVI